MQSSNTTGAYLHCINISILTLEPPRTAYNERHRLQVKHAGLECASAETIGEIACTTHSHVRLFRPLGPLALLYHYYTRTQLLCVPTNQHRIISATCAHTKTQIVHGHAPHTQTALSRLVVEPYFSSDIYYIST